MRRPKLTRRRKLALTGSVSCAAPRSSRTTKVSTNSIIPCWEASQVPGAGVARQNARSRSDALKLRQRVTGEMFFAVPCTSSPIQVLANASPSMLTSQTISISARLAGRWRFVAGC